MLNASSCTLLGMGINIAMGDGEAEGALDGVAVDAIDGSVGKPDWGDTNGVAHISFPCGTKTIFSGGERAYLTRAASSATRQPNRSWIGGKL